MFFCALFAREVPNSYVSVSYNVVKCVCSSVRNTVTSIARGITQVLSESWYRHQAGLYEKCVKIKTEVKIWSVIDRIQDNCVNRRKRSVKCLQRCRPKEKSRGRSVVLRAGVGQQWWWRSQYSALQSRSYCYTILQRGCVVPNLFRSVANTSFHFCVLCSENVKNNEKTAVQTFVSLIYSARVRVHVLHLFFPHYWFVTVSKKKKLNGIKNYSWRRKSCDYIEEVDF